MEETCKEPLTEKQLIIHPANSGNIDEASEQRLLKQTAECCNDVTSLCDFKTLMRTQVRNLFPHQLSVCGIFQIEAQRVIRLVNINYPDSYLQCVIRPDQSILIGVLDAWLCRRLPVLVNMEEVDVQPPNSWLSLASRYKLESIAAHGLVESSGHTASFFCFARLSSTSINSYARILRLLVPHLHAALTRTLTTGYLDAMNDTCCHPLAVSVEPALIIAPCKENQLLTQRENEILDWISKGKTNWEIAQILDVSKHTVKNHVRNIFKKLGVGNRVQAARTLDI